MPGIHAASPFTDRETEAQRMKPAAHAPTATCSGLPTPRRAFTLQAIKQGRQSGVGVGVGGCPQGVRTEARGAGRGPPHTRSAAQDAEERRPLAEPRGGGSNADAGPRHTRT